LHTCFDHQTPQTHFTASSSAIENATLSTLYSTRQNFKTTGPIKVTHGHVIDLTIPQKLELDQNISCENCLKLSSTLLDSFETFVEVSLKHLAMEKTKGVKGLEKTIRQVDSMQNFTGYFSAVKKK
jgi:hypothetical protein